MASKVIGSIVATHIQSGLKTVLHVHKDGGSVKFTRPDVPEWHHQCHGSVKNSAEGWCDEVMAINSPTYSEPVYYPI